MCKSFSCIVGRDGVVTWEFGVESHEALVRKAGYKDDTTDKRELKFARVEITPKNGSYLQPDEWVLRVDEAIRPTWFGLVCEDACWCAWKKWKRKLDRVLVQKPIVNPFSITPPKIIEKHIRLLREWDSVWVSVWDSVGDSVRDSVRDSVGDSVWDSVWVSVWDSVGDSVRDSVWDSVRDSVGASVRGYVGSFFRLPRKKWMYTEKIKCRGYPFQSVVDLWNMGLVPSFDGVNWRLHGGKEGEVLFEISGEKIKRELEGKVR